MPPPEVPGTSVASSEGADRIALKDTATGKYVTAGTSDAGAALKETAETGAASQFDVFDWGSGIATLRSAANGKYVGYTWSSFVNDQAQPNGWYVQQQFRLERQDDGSYLLRYAGYETAESWWSNPVYLGPTGDDGTLGLVPEEQAAHYTKDVVRSGADEAVAAVRGKDTAVVARLGSGAARFTARVAGTGSGTVEVRLGSPTGTLVGTAHTDGTASAYDYETVTGALASAARGRQDVYLVLSAGLRLSAFSLR